VSGLVDPLAAPFRYDGSTGTAFVLIHGFTGNPAHFRPLGRELHDLGHTVNAPLLPGHGTDAAALAGVTGDQWLGSTLDAVREVGDHHRIHLVGLSMGGLLSILAARRQTVSSLTTIDAPISFRRWRIHLAFLARHFVEEVHWPEEEAPPMDDEMRPYWIHVPGFPTSAAAELARVSYRARFAARRLHIPSLVIQSKVDETVRPRSGRLLAAALGDRCRLLWLEDSMHNALFDSERDAVRDAILELAT